MKIVQICIVVLLVTLVSLPVISDHGIIAYACGGNERCSVSSTLESSASSNTATATPISTTTTTTLSTRNSVDPREMTNHVYDPTGNGYSTQDIIDHYATNFTVSDNLGLREWRVGFVASDAIHGYFIQAFFQEDPLPGSFEGAPAAMHLVTLKLWTRKVLTQSVSVVATNQGSQILNGKVPNRTILAGDFVDFFIAHGYLQVFWYQTNSTIHNQQQIFSVNISVPNDFTFTDEYQFFSPVPGASSIHFTNFRVDVLAQQISNVYPHMPIAYLTSTATNDHPTGALEPTLQTSSNLCFENPTLQSDHYGVHYSLNETMFSSDIDPFK